MRAVLVADIGGTKARVAVVDGENPLRPIVLNCRDFSSIENVLHHAMEIFGLAVGRACIGVAGPVFGDEVSITNNGWTFSIAAARERLGLHELVVVNDFTALAWALSSLEDGNLVQVGGEACRPAMPQLLIGPGTGLGMAVVLFGDTSNPSVVSSEGGYVTLPVHTDRELAAWHVLRARYGRVSAERVLCGGGLVELHQALAIVDGMDGPGDVSSYDIVGRGVSDALSRERETLDVFLALLGDVAGNAALVSGARGGVFLSGELLIEMVSLIPGSSLRERMEAKGRGRPFLANVGTFLITDRFAALKGCARLLGLHLREGGLRSGGHAA